MAKLFGHLTLNDTDFVFQATAGQRAIYEAVTDYVNRENEGMTQQLATLVSEVTSEHTMRFYLPGAGYLQTFGPDGRPSAVKATGYWDVAFPLVIKGDQSVGNRTAMAHMTVEGLRKHVLTVVADNFNSVRRDLLERLVNNVATTVSDDEWGNLTVQPLANSDGTLYPPIISAMAEAQENHYLASGYLSANISDANDPFVTIVADLVHHFGFGSNVITWINSAETAVVEALTSFTPVADPRLKAGTQTAIPIGVPPGVPGTVIGYHSDGTWVAVWDYIPANYLLGTCLDAIPPLVKRIDRAGLAPNLTLVIEDDEYPFVASFWEHRYGFGCGNRLNGVVMKLTEGAYSIPTIV